MTEKTQNIILITSLALLLLLQLYWLLKKRELKRRPLKITLNLLLWISIVSLLFPITSKNSNNLNKIGIVDDVIPDAFIAAIKDSLNLEKIVSKAEYLQKYVDKNLEINLLGQTFEGAFLSNLIGKKVVLYPYFEQNAAQTLEWRAIIRQNESQEVKGTIHLEKPNILKLKFGSQTLDSVKLEKGLQYFNLSFPSFSLGKTGIALTLDDQPINEIKYYALPSAKFNILILAENPDFETKTLSDWLGKNGHTVEVQTTITKNTLNNTSINKQNLNGYDLVFSTPERAKSQICQKVLNNGGGVFIYNINENTIPAINKIFNSEFRIQRISSESEQKLQNDLVGLPYKFVENQRLLNLKNWPIAVNNRKVGVSLISETFPLILSGDSITYRKIWGSVLQLLQPLQKSNIEILAPIVKDLNAEIRFNNYKENTNSFATKTDSIYTKISPINSKTSFGNYTFRANGWQTINDSLEVFVNDNTDSFTALKYTQTVLNTYLKSKNSTDSNTEIETQILPDWLSFLICTILFILIWIEAKW